MPAPTFDLQSHSTVSDGALPPNAVVRAATAVGVRTLALTDHDSVEGVAEALDEATRQGIRLIPAAELSSVHGDHEDLHLLGYGLDHTSAALRAALQEFREDRARRITRMADALEELSFALDRDRLDARSAAGRPIGRPHLAQAAFDANRDRLAADGITDPGAFLEAYLVPGAPAYRRRTTPTIGEAIDTVHEAGGLAVWAHPFWDVEDPDDVTTTVEHLARQGLDGVEAFYATHTREQTHIAYEAARAHGLLTTGSADFHGPDHPHFSRFRAFELYGLTPELGPLS